jgi:hypothetical protein
MNDGEKQKGYKKETRPLQKAGFLFMNLSPNST